MTAPIVTVRGLTARVGGRTLLEDVSFELRAGQVTALVGPSGSGKTTAALALLGEHGDEVRVTGHVQVAAQDVVTPAGVRPQAALLRGSTVAFLPQHPGEALNPARRVGTVLREIARVHRRGGDAVTEALRRAGLDDSRALRRRFPHQFSGGQRQRVALAEVLACDPRVLVLDEPTTGLDAITKAAVVAELAALARAGIAVLLLSHDLPVVWALAQQVVALRSGRVEARGTPAEVLPAPTARSFAGPAPAPEAEVLTVERLRAAHKSHTVLREVSLALAPGQCTAVVGPSGSGKTTLARCVAGLHEPASGVVRLDGTALPVLRRRDRHQKRHVQYVWQEVRASFEAGRPVLGEVARTAIRLRGVSPAAATAEAVELLARLGVDEATARRTPSGLSGGELQRAAVVRALLAGPGVLVCDEVTTALDASAAHAVLDLLAERRRDHGTAVLLITHDWDVACAQAGHALMFDQGTVVGEGSPQELANASAHGL